MCEHTNYVDMCTLHAKAWQINQNEMERMSHSFCAPVNVECSYTAVRNDTIHRRRQQWRCAVFFWFHIRVFKSSNCCTRGILCTHIGFYSNGKIYIFKSVNTYTHTHSTHSPATNTSMFMFCWHICHWIYLFYLLVFVATATFYFFFLFIVVFYSIFRPIIYVAFVSPIEEGGENESD